VRQAEGRHRDLDDPGFLARLRQGEPAAYRVLVRRLHASLVGVATAVIGSRAQAEEVVQDSWLAVYSGIGRFEGRSSLTTWLFSIVLNRARTRAGREGRLMALPVLDGGEPNERAVPRSAFQPDGHWIDPPRLWDELDPERVVGGRQLWEHVQAAIERLPQGQRAVLLLRDIEGCPAEDICALLEITPENQRVLLHRARGRIRAAVDALPGMRTAPLAGPALRAAKPGNSALAGRVCATLWLRWSAGLRLAALLAAPAWGLTGLRLHRPADSVDSGFTDPRIQWTADLSRW